MLKKYNFNPISKTKNVSTEKLMILLNNNKHGKFFCWHNWIQWKFSKANRQHRICEKCGKRQKNMDIFNDSPSIWIKDTVF